jgi:hypothetical protein
MFGRRSHGSAAASTGAPPLGSVSRVVVAFLVIGLVVVVVVAVVAVGQAVGRLEPEPERQIFAHGEAVSFVAEALPDEVTATLSYEEVARIMRLHLDFLHDRGVARSGGDLEDGAGPVVIEPGEAVGFVVDRAARVGFHPERAHVEEVIEAQLAYFEAIGAIAPVAEPDLELTGEDVDDPDRGRSPQQ